MKKYVQVLNVIAALCVVFLHVNDSFWSFSYGINWLIANIIECTCYFAVPIFFMISGCNLMDYRKKYSTEQYFHKRIVKCVIPFLVWSVIAGVYMVLARYISIQDISIKMIIDSVVNTKFLGIYWFFMPLFSVYLCIPVFSAIPFSERKRVFQYLLGTAFILNITLPFVFSIFNLNFNHNFGVTVAGGYLFYAIAGYYIDNYEIKKNYRKVIYVLGVIGLLMHIVGTAVLSYHDGAINGLFKEYLNVPCVLYSVAVFVFFKYTDKTKIMDILFEKTTFFADTTFGIYLTHWFFKDILWRIPGIDTTSLSYKILGSIGIFLVAALLVKIVKRIPVLKKMIP